jgi:osmotically-inducible protein OsmY
MNVDTDIRQKVLAELQCDPRVDERSIGVMVHNGVVTLVGSVSRGTDRWTAAELAGRVAGVRAIANDIELQPPECDQCDDSELAETAADVLRWNLDPASAKLQVVVKKGWITLLGQVTTHLQRTIAETSVRHLTGVKGVVNSITLKAPLPFIDLREGVEQSLRRLAGLEAKNVIIEVKGGEVILNGQVSSAKERNDASALAWADGVSKVENLLVVEP